MRVTFGLFSWSMAAGLLAFSSRQFALLGSTLREHQIISELVVYAYDFSAATRPGWSLESPLHVRELPEECGSDRARAPK